MTDLIYALRQLHRNRSFAVVIVLSLALGIGANTTVFSVIESVLLRPLPFYAPERLFAVWATTKKDATREGTSGPEFQDYKEQTRSFQYLANVIPSLTITWTGAGEPRVVNCTGISYDFFSMLGTKPLLGRVYTKDEYLLDGVVVVISEHFWRSSLGADPQIIGRTLQLDGTSQTVIGVIPSLPDLFPNTDVWTKNVPSFQWMRIRSNKFLTLYGRLNDGANPRQAEEELTAILQRGAGESADTAVRLIPLKEELVGDVRAQLQLVMCAVGLILLITCVNVAYLLLAQGSKRRAEIAVRLSLGASRARILRQFAVENLVLSMLGGGLALVLAAMGVRILSNLGVDFPRSQTIGIDQHVLIFAFSASILCSLLLAWAPTVVFSKIDLIKSLKTGRSEMGSVGRWQFRTLLVAEVSMAIFLMIGAGLLLRSFRQAQRVDPGFRPERVLTGYLRTSREPGAERIFFGELLRRTSVLPGAEASAVAGCVPGVESKEATVSFDDRPNDPYNQPTIQSCWISPEFFRVIGAPLLRGRTFSDSDSATAPPIVIVNRTFAAAYWPGQDPIGKKIAPNYIGSGRNGANSPGFREVVGVVSDIKQNGLDQSAAAAIYMPYLQDETNHVFAGMHLFVRGRGEVSSLSGSLRAAVHQVNADQPIEELQAMETVLAQTLAPRRFTLTMFGGFALLAMLLCVTGVYGTIAYWTEKRTREMGLRIALGALRKDLVLLVISECVVLTSCGLAIGIAASLAASRAIRGFLFDVTPTDPFTIITASVLLLIVCAAACFPSSWKASSVAPMSALRTE